MRAQLLMIGVAIVFIPASPLPDRLPVSRWSGRRHPSASRCSSGALVFGLGMQLGGGQAPHVVYGRRRQRADVDHARLLRHRLIGTAHSPWWLELSPKPSAFGTAWRSRRHGRDARTRRRFSTRHHHRRAAPPRCARAAATSPWTGLAPDPRTMAAHLGRPPHRRGSTPCDALIAGHPWSRSPMAFASGAPRSPTARHSGRVDGNSGALRPGGSAVRQRPRRHRLGDGDFRHHHRRRRFPPATPLASSRRRRRCRSLPAVAAALGGLLDGSHGARPSPSAATIGRSSQASLRERRSHGWRLRFGRRASPRQASIGISAAACPATASMEFDGHERSATRFYSAPPSRSPLRRHQRCRPLSSRPRALRSLPARYLRPPPAVQLARRRAPPYPRSPSPPACRSGAPQPVRDQALRRRCAPRLLTELVRQAQQRPTGSNAIADCTPSIARTFEIAVALAFRSGATEVRARLPLSLPLLRVWPEVAGRGLAHTTGTAPPAAPASPADDRRSAHAAARGGAVLRRDPPEVGRRMFCARRSAPPIAAWSHVPRATSSIRRAGRSGTTTRMCPRSRPSTGTSTSLLRPEGATARSTILWRSALIRFGRLVRLFTVNHWVVGDSFRGRRRRRSPLLAAST